MTAPRLRLTRSHADDLAAVCELGREKLTQIGKTLDAIGLTIRPSKVEQAIATQVDKQTAEVLARVLFGLATLRRRSRAQISELLDGVEESLASIRGNEARVEALRACKSDIGQLLASTPVVMTAKALDLAYDFSQVFVGARIITDIRPVFDEPQKDDIVGATIVQTIKMESVDSEGTAHKISIALDLDDVQQLKDSCEEALRKAAAAKKLAEEDFGIETMIPGEEME